MLRGSTLLIALYWDHYVRDSCHYPVLLYNIPGPPDWQLLGEKRPLDGFNELFPVYL